MTRPEPLTVRGCRTCPLAGLSGRVRVCQHPDGPGRRCEDWEPPHWCPLRGGELVVRIEQPATETPR